MTGMTAEEILTPLDLDDARLAGMSCEGLDDRVAGPARRHAAESGGDVTASFFGPPASTTGHLVSLKEDAIYEGGGTLDDADTLASRATMT